MASSCQRESGDPTKVHATAPPPPPVYGTFSAQSSHPPLPPLAPVPHQQPFQPQAPTPYHVVQVGYQSYAYPVVAEGVPVVKFVRERPLPCCGIGIGWALFVAGFFFAAVPWYVGTFILLFVAIDYREKAGLVACTVAAVLAAITAILGISKDSSFW